MTLAQEQLGSLIFCSAGKKDTNATSTTEDLISKFGTRSGHRLDLR